jgi:small-conductance mechanosensitive channel
LRATHLRTPNGTDLVVPNHQLVTSVVYNHSHPLERARIAIELWASAGENVDRIEETLLSVAHEHPRVLDEPAPLVQLDAFHQNMFQFHLYVWVQEPVVITGIASQLRFAIAHAFAQRNLQFPVPELRLRGATVESEPGDAGLHPE